MKESPRNSSQGFSRKRFTEPVAGGEKEERRGSDCLGSGGGAANREEMDQNRAEAAP